MPARFLLYPVLLMVVMSTARLCRGPRWYRWRLLQMLAIGAVSVVGLVHPSQAAVMATAAWALYGLFVTVPWGIRTYATQLQNRYGPAAPERALRWLPLVEWGPPGQCAYDSARALAQAADGHAQAVIDFCTTWLRSDPPAGVRCFILSEGALNYFFVRNYVAAVACWEKALPWAPSPGKRSLHFVTTQMRMVRAYSELRRWPEAEAALQDFLAAPTSRMVLANAASTLFLTEVFGCAGDLEHLNSLLADKDAELKSLSPALASYWRGRCHLARGDTDSARRWFEQAAQELPASSHFWKEALQRKLAESDDPQAVPPAPPPTFIDLLLDLQAQSRAAATFLGLRPQPATMGIIALCVLGWALTALFGGDDKGVMLLAGAMTHRLIEQGEYWRLLTATFLHIGKMHLGFNCLVLLFYGSAVESVYGGFRMLLIFLAAAVVGNWASVPQMTDQIGVGASGGAMGTIGAMIPAFALASAVIPTVLRRQMIGQILLIAVIQVILDRQEPIVNGTAHLVGFLSGIALGYVLFPRVQATKAEPTFRVAPAVAALAVLLAIGQYFTWQTDRALGLVRQAGRNQDAASMERAASMNRFNSRVLREAANRSEGWQPQSALRYCNRALAINPLDSLAYVIRGQLYNDAHDFQAAADDFTRSIRLDDTAAAYIDRGYSEYMLRRYEAAIGDCDRALALNPQAPPAYIIRCCAELCTMHGALAAKDAQRFLDLFGWKQPESNFMAVNGYFGSAEKGGHLLEQARQQCDPTRWPYPALLYLQRHITADQLLHEAARSGADTDAHAWIGMNLLQQGHTEGALVQLKWLEENGDPNAYTYTVATAQLGTSRPQKRL